MTDRHPAALVPQISFPGIPNIKYLFQPTWTCDHTLGLQKPRWQIKCKSDLMRQPWDGESEKNPTDLSGD